MDWSRKWLVDFNAGKTHLILFDWSSNTGAIDVKMGGSALEKKSTFKMQGLTFCSKLEWGAYIIYIAKKASKKIGPLICSMNFLLLRLLCISVNWPCGHTWNTVVIVWAGAPICYLKLLDKLQRQICRTVGPSLAVSPETRAHHENEPA